MKKRITILSIAAMLSTLTLASCGKGYTYKDGIMLYVNDKPLTTEEVFATYGGMSSSEGWTQSGISTYYDAINNINIEADIAKDDEMDRTVKSKMDAFYQAAKDDAANNGTNQSAEIEKALDSAVIPPEPVHTVKSNKKSSGKGREKGKKKKEISDDREAQNDLHE